MGKSNCDNKTTRHPRFFRTSGNEFGYSLIEIMAVAGIVSFALLALATVNLKMLSGNNGTPERAQLDTFRRSVMGLIQDNKAWANTVAADNNIHTCFNPPPETVCTTTPGQPANTQGCANNCFGGYAQWAWFFINYLPSYSGTQCYFSCVSQSTPPVTTCTPPTVPACPAQYVSQGNARQFAIRDDNNNLFYNSSLPDQGVSRTGKACTGFSSARPTPDCPYRYDIRWYAVTATQNPFVAVTASLQVSPGTQRGASLNTDSFALTVPLIRAAK